jgi:hypothetical protein
LPDDEFSFRSLIKPGAGAKAGMEKEVANRAAHEQMVPGQWYSGVGEMLKSHGTYFPGRELPDQYEHLVGEEEHCHMNALLACEQDPTLRYFTGWYAVNYDITHHSWCVDPDGEVVEVTYGTKQPEPGTVMGSRPGGTGTPIVATRLGWMPPSTWSYVGLEFDASFVRRWYDATGLLPLLELKGHTTDTIAAKPFIKPYKVSGYELPTEQEIEDYTLSAESAWDDLEPDEGWSDDDDVD